MQLQRVVHEPEDLRLKNVKETVFTGRLSESEVRLAQHDPVTFLKAAEHDVPEDAEIRVSIENFSTAAARRARAAYLCRVTITCIGRFCVIHIVCIPVIVIACW